MKLQIHRHERMFLYASTVVLALFFGAVILSVSEAGIHLPTDVDTIDPQAVDSTAPFDNPGVFQTGDDEVSVVMVAEAWGYTPNVITVPVGSEVTFTVTSKDVIHGFMIPRTTVNAMLIPGQVTRVTYTFDEAGEHDLLCHEFCGIGHHNMFARVVVEG
jgi:cytochrome c oxidase subunit 2